MVIRGYCPEDCKEAAKLFCETIYRVNAKDYTKAQLDAWAAAAGDLEAWGKPLLESHTLVAEENGAMAGFGNVNGVGVLDRLYVHHGHQRRGVAAALVAALEQHARQCGQTRMATFASITARPFFEKQGYTVVKQQRVRRRGETLTNFRMEKTLCP